MTFGVWTTISKSQNDITG